MPALSANHERVVLFIAGILAVVTCTLCYRHITIQEYTALMGNPALAGAIRRIGAGYGEILGSFFLFLAMAVWRPAPLGRYFNVLFWVWCTTLVLTFIMEDDLHPRQREVFRPTDQTEQVEQTQALAPQSGHGPRPEGTMEKWAQVVKDTPIALNKDLAAYEAEIKPTDGIESTVMLTEPDQTAARLTRGRGTIERHRASIAKIIAHARAALEGEQRVKPSPLLKMYEDRFAKQGKVIDRDLAAYDAILAEFDATLHDLSNPHGLIEPRDGKVHFTTTEDRDTYTGHVARIKELVQQRRALRDGPSPQDGSPKAP